MDFDSAQQLNEWEPSLADRIVKAFLNGRQHINGYYAEDLLQECLIHWLTVRGSYVAGRGASPPGFMRRVLRSKLIDFQRAATARRRGGRQSPVSLDMAVGSGEEPAALGDLLPGTTDIDNELQLDLGSVLNKLSDRQRRVIRGMLEGYGVTELSRILPWSRATVQEEVRRIRQIFTDEGLRDYLHK